MHINLYRTLIGSSALVKTQAQPSAAQRSAAQRSLCVNGTLLSFK